MGEARPIETSNLVHAEINKSQPMDSKPPLKLRRDIRYLTPFILGAPTVSLGRVKLCISNLVCALILISASAHVINYLKGYAFGVT